MADVSFQDVLIGPNPNNCPFLWRLDRTWTVTDFCGWTATCVQVLNFTDTTPPTALCQPFTVVIQPSETGSVVVSDVDAGSTDNCGTPSLSLVGTTAFDCDDIGMSFNVTLTVTDNCNLVSSCTATVSVEDPNANCCAPPVAVCSDQTVQLDGNGDGSVTPAQVGAGSDADCGLASETVNPSDFDCNDIGPNTVTYTITDIDGVSSTCTAVMTVEDNIAPTAGCQNTTIQLDINGDGGQTAAAVESGSSDNCGTVNTVSLNPDIFGCSDVGDNTVTLTINDGNGNTATCTATATVEDLIQPTISCPNDGTVNTNPGSCEATFMVPTPTANDNCAVTVLRYRYRPVDAMGNNIPGEDWSSWTTAVMQTLDVGHWKIQWQAKDASNNQKKCAFIIEVVDNEAPNAVCFNPTIEFNGEAEIFLTVDQVWDDAISSDNCDIPMLVDYSPTSLTCDQLGMIIPVTVTIEDASGNPAQCTANVTVSGLPCGWIANPDGINCPDGNEASFDPNTNTFEVSSEGCYDPNYYSNTDLHGFVGTQLCGDGEIIAHVTQVTGSGFAGISMREDLSAGSKMLQLSVDGVFLTKREMRTTTGALAYNHLFQTQGKNWLRLTRSGNTFTAQHSLDGVSWSPVIITDIDMASCIEIGLITENDASTGSTTATFENVEIKTAGMNLSTPRTELDAADDVEVEVRVYPNPTTGETFVDLGGYIGQKVSIQVYNNLGQAVKLLEVDEVQIPTQRLDLSGYQNGLYFITIQIPDQPEITRKLMLMGEQ